MKTEEALKIIGGSLSKPSKMPGWSIGLPAKECKQAPSSGLLKVQLVTIVMHLKVVMYLKLYKMPSIEGWQL